MQAHWSEHLLPGPGCTLAWYEAGAGQTVIFLSGGPGDSHYYMRSVAQPLAASFHCVSYDQRGTGKSQLEPLDQETLRIAHFFEDIEAIRTHLGLERIGLVGHSWGATLALLYSATHPEQVENVTLVGLGPLNTEMGAVASANADKPLNAEERMERQQIAAQRRAAIDAGDFETQRELHILLATTFGARGSLYSPEARHIFKSFFRRFYDSNPFVNQIVSSQLFGFIEEIRLWERLRAFKAPMLIIYGYQDFEPITQAYLLKEHVPHARLFFLNQCGHNPWLEQPAQFYAALEAFL